MVVALMLISLALGYKVYVDATREKDGLRILGQVIGIVVMLASVGGFICGSVKCMKGGDCSMGSHKSGSKMCQISEEGDPGKNICPIKGPMSEK